MNKKKTDGWRVCYWLGFGKERANCESEKRGERPVLGNGRWWRDELTLLSSTQDSSSTGSVLMRDIPRERSGERRDRIRIDQSFVRLLLLLKHEGEWDWWEGWTRFRQLGINRIGWDDYNRATEKADRRRESWTRSFFLLSSSAVGFVSRERDDALQQWSRVNGGTGATEEDRRITGYRRWRLRWKEV